MVYPRTEIEASEEMLISLKLAKAGYFGGNPESVLQARVNVVLEALEYEKYLYDYDTALRELNE